MKERKTREHEVRGVENGALKKNIDRTKREAQGQCLVEDSKEENQQTDRKC